MTKNILFLDIDDTLLETTDVKVYFNNGTTRKVYSSKEYAKLIVKEEDKKYFDFSDGHIPERIIKTINTSRPIKRSLDIVNNFLEYGFELGIITARGGETTLKKVMPNWLRKQLKYPFKMKQSNIYAVNDQTIKYEGNTDQEKKLNVLKYHINKGEYDNIYFMDDNKNTINMVMKFNEELEEDKKISLLHVDWTY